mgnify:FL=1
MARVFSAIDIEDEDVLKEIENVQETVDLGFSKTPSSKLHITLQFFEDINQSQIKKIKKTLKNIETEPFEAEIRGVGAFPSEEYIRVVWAGVKSHEIFKLQKQSKVHDVASDNRHEFKPHATFLRVDDITRKRKKRLQRNIKEFRDHSFGKIKVDKVKLFESRVTGKGSEYSVLSEIDL